MIRNSSLCSIGFTISDSVIAVGLCQEQNRVFIVYVTPFMNRLDLQKCVSCIFKRKPQDELGWQARLAAALQVANIGVCIGDMSQIDTDFKTPNLFVSITPRGKIVVVHGDLGGCLRTEEDGNLDIVKQTQISCMFQSNVQQLERITASPSRTACAKHSNEFDCILCACALCVLSMRRVQGARPARPDSSVGHHF